MNPSTVELGTFLAAMLGYAGLAAVVLASAVRPMPLAFWRVVSLSIALHVGLVWAYRYEWQFDRATRNGYAGFLIFHTALLLILASTVVRERAAVILVRLAFPVVTAGALGAVFRYEAVAVYRIPVILCAVGGGLGVLMAYYRLRRPAVKAV